MAESSRTQDTVCRPYSEYYWLTREELVSLACFFPEENCFRLDLETGGGEARLPTEGQDRCVGTLSCPAAPGKQRAQIVLWEFQTWSEDERACSSSLELRNLIGPKGKKGRKNAWPPQFP